MEETPPKSVTKAPKESEHYTSFEGYKASDSYFGGDCRLEGIGKGNMTWHQPLAGLDISVLPFYVKDAFKIPNLKSLRFHYVNDGVFHTFDLLSEEKHDMEHAVKVSRWLKGRILREEMDTYIKNIMGNNPKK